MSDTLKTLEHNGYTIKIKPDPDIESPYGGNDTAVKIVILHRRYKNPNPEVGNEPGDVEQWRKDNEKEWFTIPLWAYDHSGIVYRVGQSNPFTCQWDSGRAGIVALKRSEFGDGRETDEKLAERAADVAKVYSAYANGEGCGYVIEDREGNEIDSCWGFYSDDEAIEQAKENTPNEPAPMPKNDDMEIALKRIDKYIERIREDHAANDKLAGQLDVRVATAEHIKKLIVARLTNDEAQTR